jgi:hypothetical protein
VLGSAETRFFALGELSLDADGRAEEEEEEEESADTDDAETDMKKEDAGRDVSVDMDDDEEARDTEEEEDKAVMTLVLRRPHDATRLALSRSRFSSRGDYRRHAKKQTVSVLQIQSQSKAEYQNLNSCKKPQHTFFSSLTKHCASRASLCARVVARMPIMSACVMS